MLSHYLAEQDVKRLTNSIRNHSILADRIVWCFYGQGNNGKSTVAEHLVSFVNGIVNFGDSIDLLETTRHSYIIISVNTLQDLEKVKNICGKRKYVFLRFDFPYNMKK